MQVFVKLTEEQQDQDSGWATPVAITVDDSDEDADKAMEKLKAENAKLVERNQALEEQLAEHGKGLSKKRRR